VVEVVNEKAVVFREVEFSYGKQSILADLNFEIAKGEFVAITGPNGAGKTTLLKLTLGILRPQKGEIRVMGYSTKDRDKIMNLAGFIPQKEHISMGFPILVRDVVMLGITAKKGITKPTTRADEEAGMNSLKAVGLGEEIWKKKFAELSGGQQQRVLLARALSVSPKILLLDEPFNGVDVPTQKKIVELISALREKGVAILLVVHNVNPLLHEIDKIMLLNRRLIAFGKPDEVFTEKNLIATYGATIPVIYCEEGFAHPAYGDIHG
jgi:ABC-type Mn2+/Zn2+ transport system ATPase subunit